MLPAALEESASTAGPSKARKRIGIGILGVLLAAGIASCGGTRQDANEPSGDFPVQIVSADFPSRQQLAQNTNLTLAVANSGDKTIPNLAITIFTASNENPGADETTTTGTTGTGTTSTTNDLPTVQGSFSVRSPQQGLAIPFRPVWILETGYPKLEGETASAGAEAAQTDTYAFGALPPHQTKSIVWNVTAVQGGTYTVHYRVAAGLEGKAKALTANGSIPEGEFVVRISTAPPQTRVNDSGQVVPIKPSDIVGQSGNAGQKSKPGGSGTSTSP
ncbi:MAG: hypothetical protein WA701_10750 [Solirubrobacterales bacterium]